MSRSTGRVVAAALCAALAWLIVCFPEPPRAIVPGIDPGWIYALNSLFHRTDVALGRDYVFTVGPLGWLIFPADIASNVAWSYAFRIASQLAIAGVLVAFAIESRRLLPALCAFAGLTFAWSLMPVAYGLGPDMIPIVAGAALVLAAHRWPSPWLFAVAAAYAGVCLFIKITLAIPLLAVLGVVSLGARRRSWAMAAAAGAFALVALAFAVRLFPDVSAAVRWASVSRAYLGGYAEAMSVTGAGFELWLALMFVLVGFAPAVLVFRRDRLSALFPAALLPLAVVSFRHGFVRQDMHVTLFFATVLAAMSLSAVLWTTRRELIVGAICLVAAFGVALLDGGLTRRLDKARTRDTLIGRVGVEQLGTFLQASKSRQFRADLSAGLLKQQQTLPAEWLKLLQANGATMDVVPMELTYAVANALDWKPQRTLQLYASYTPALDGWSAGRFETGPEYLVVGSTSIDGRHTFNEAPETWRALLSRYELVAREGALFLVRRRASPVALQWVNAGETTGKVGEIVAVPESSALLFSDLELEPSLWGRLRRALFRFDPIRIEATLEDGSRSEYRIVPALAPSGLLISPLPSTAEEYASLFDVPKAPRVRGIRVTGEGAAQLAPEFRIRWRELR